MRIYYSYRMTHQDGKNLLLTSDSLSSSWGLLLQPPTAQAGWQNIQNPSQREVFTILMGHPVVYSLTYDFEFDVCLDGAVDAVGGAAEVGARVEAGHVQQRQLRSLHRLLP